jgi:hypothetical protein
VDRLGGAPLRPRRRAAARPAAQADPLGLHHPQPAQGRGALPAYDDLEERIARLQEQEELDAIRPDLDGNQIMELLGVSPGPVVGRAYKFLLELRLDEGPLGYERAVSELREWWARQPEAVGPAAQGPAPADC